MSGVNSLCELIGWLYIRQRMNLAERKRKLPQGGYWCSLDVSDAGFVALFLVLVFLAVVTLLGPGYQPVVPVDLAYTPHAVELTDALREDSLHIVVRRDGTLFLGRDKLLIKQLTVKLKDRVSMGTQRIVYISADQRTKYGNVVAVVNAVHAAGIDRIGFLTEKRADPAEFRIWQSLRGQ